VGKTQNMSPKIICSLEFSLLTFFVSRQRKQEQLFGLTKTGQLNSWLSNNYILVEVPDLLNRKDHYYL